MKRHELIPHNTWNPSSGVVVAPNAPTAPYIGRVIRKQTDHVTGEKREAWGRLYRTAPPVRASPDGVEAEPATARSADLGWSPSPISSAPTPTVARRGMGRDPLHLIWSTSLTKRPALVSRLRRDWGRGWPNVWLGTSVAAGYRSQDGRPRPSRCTRRRCASCTNPAGGHRARRLRMGDRRQGKRAPTRSTSGTRRRIWRKELNTPGRRTISRVSCATCARRACL